MDKTLTTTTTCGECGGAGYFYDSHGDYSASGQPEEIPCPRCQRDDDDAPLCSAASVPSQLHPWVCLRPAVDRPDGVGLVRVTCTFCGHEFELEYTGLLDGCMFPVPEHEPGAVRFHGPAYMPLPEQVRS